MQDEGGGSWEETSRVLTLSNGETGKGVVEKEKDGKARQVIGY